ncbi:MAG: tripartite tricarboxylate transporter permease [Bilophila wadsworthia]
MTDLVNAFMGVFDPVSFALITGGTIFGIIFGAIPGLTATLAVILLIPLSYGLEPTQGISMLVGVYIGGISGGVVAAVLLGMPGTPSSMVTVLDGFALAKQGRAGKALGAGVTANLAGSFIGWLFLIALAPQVARFALKFGPIENTAVLLFGFTAVISLSGGSITKGICMTALGMAFSTVGVDPISTWAQHPRLPSDQRHQPDARHGRPFVVAQAFAEMDTLSERFIIAASRLTDRFMSLTELRASLPNFIRSGLIGTAIGILPGIGGTLASVVAYDQQKRAAKHPENYGRGELQGIIASETANNATIGGALIPFLALGIPGDTVTAALLGGLQIHGLDPGPILFSRHMDMVYGVFVAFILSCVVMYVFMQFVGTYVFPVALRLQKKYILPLVMVMSLIGCYNMEYSMMAVWVALAFGVLGYVLKKFRYPLMPLIIGLILGPMFERELRLACIQAGGSFAEFLSSPIALVFLALTVLSLAVALRKGALLRKG